MHSFLDTSAILNGGLKDYPEACVSPLILTELENIKNGNKKDDNVKYQAREAIRKILVLPHIDFFTPTRQKDIDKMLKKEPMLSDIPDHRILCEAILYAQEMREHVNFVTSDSALYLFACQMPHLNAIYYEKDKGEEELWSGWGKYFPNDKELAALYEDPKINTLHCRTNEFAEIFVGNTLKDILFWTGEEYRPLKYKELYSKFLGETIRPRNIEQKMTFDLLQNPDIPVKLLTGVPGSGKDYLMFLHAWDLVQKGKKDKIIFIRNLVPFKDAPEIGFLQGSLQEKIAWGLGPIESILGEEGLLMAQQAGQIEAVNLGFIRGCSWDNVILYVSEGQNITGGGYKLLVSRCGKNSELWINGDILQTDDKKFDSNNGVKRLLKSLDNNKLFGSVKLLKTERSEIAELASQI